MALSGSFTSYPYDTFGLYVSWSAIQDRYAATSTVTAKVYLSYYSAYITNKTGASWIYGYKKSVSNITIHDTAGGSWKKKLLWTQTQVVQHDKTTGKIGAVNIAVDFNYNGNYGNIYVGKISAKKAIYLDTIDRVAPKITATITDATDSTFTLNVVSDSRCNKWWYTLNAKASNPTWYTIQTSELLNFSKVITGLTPNAKYDVQVCGNRAWNDVDGYSSIKTIQMLGGSYFKNVSNILIDDSSPVFYGDSVVYNSTYTHTIDIQDGDGKVLATISNVKISNGHTSVKVPSDIREKVLKILVNKQSINGMITVHTYDGGTEIGSGKTNHNVIITTSADRSAPILGAFIFKDVNPVTAAVTGNNQVLIRYASQLQVDISNCTPRNFATIVSYSVACGDMTKTSTTGKGMKLTDISAVGTVPIIATVIDSRGYSTSMTKNVKILNYEKIDITDYDVRRANEVEPYLNVSIRGSYAPLSETPEPTQVSVMGFVPGVNAFKALEYRVWKTSEKPPSNYTDIPTVQSTDSTFDFTNPTWKISPELDPEYSYFVEFRARDKLTSDSVRVTIGQSISLMSFRKKKVGINNRNPSSALDVNGIIKMNGFNVMGIIKHLTSEDLNDITEAGIFDQPFTVEATAERNYPHKKACFIEVLNGKENRLIQRCTSFDGRYVDVRSLYEHVWSKWYTIPIDAPYVIDSGKCYDRLHTISGSMTEWHYKQWSDNTFECWNSFEGSVQLDTKWGGTATIVYNKKAVGGWPWPVAFADTPIVTDTARTKNGDGILMPYRAAASIGGLGEYSFWGIVLNTTIDYNLSIRAIGKVADGVRVPTDHIITY